MLHNQAESSTPPDCKTGPCYGRVFLLPLGWRAVEFNTKCYKKSPTRPSKTLGGQRTKEAKSHNLQSTNAHFITTWRSPRRTKWDHGREDLMWPFAADARQHWMSGRIWSLSEQIKNVIDLSEFLLGTNSPFLSQTMTCRDAQDKVRWGSDARIVFSVCLREVYLSASFLFFSLVHQISILIKKCLLVLWNPDTVAVAAAVTTPRHCPSP